MNGILYLDHAAAGIPDEALLKRRAELDRECSGNQEAGHALGFELRKRIDAAARELGRALWRVENARAVWGTNCTELFNLLAASPLVRGKRAVSSVLEHPALGAALKREAGELKLLREGRVKFLVLASGCPRLAKILREHGVVFVVVKSDA